MRDRVLHALDDATPEQHYFANHPWHAPHKMQNLVRSALRVRVGSPLAPLARVRPPAAPFKKWAIVQTRRSHPISVRGRFMARVQSTRFVFQPVMLVRPAEVVAFRITEAIRAGDVRVGEKLPSEQGLSRQLGIGRPTLREAIKLLIQAGIVEVQPGSSGGIFITSETIPAELCGYPMPELPLQDMDNVLEARRLFEPHVARLAAMYATSADFERMRDAVQLSDQTSSRFRNKRLTDEGARLMTLASTRFNVAVARATQNVMVVQMMEVMLRHMEMVRMRAVRELSDFSLSTQSLRNSLLAIESGDPHQIDAATSERIGLLESAWEMASGKRLRRRPVLQASTVVVVPRSRRLRSGSALVRGTPLDR